MPNKYSGCGCCGCQTFEYSLNPDFYFPVEVVSFVKERIVTSTRVVVRSMLRTGEDEIEGEVIDDDTYPTDATFESTDSKPVAGRWEWVYPQEESFTDSEPVIVGGGESFQRTTTYFDKTVHEERRLFLRFNVSNQYRFGLEDDDENPYIESSHYLVAIEKYLRDGYPIGPISGPVPDGQVRYLTTESATAKGFLFDATTPANSAAFDTLFSGLATSHDLTTGPPEGTTLIRDCESWLPDEETMSLALLIDAPEGEGQGVQIDEAKLSINDIEDRSNSSIIQEYDWTRDWIREEEGIIVSKRLFPNADVEIDMEDLIVGDWFDTPSHRMRIEMFTEAIVEGEVEETTYAEQEFFVEAIPPASSEEDYQWFFRSEGTWGNITHAEAESESGIESPFTTLAARLVVRENVIELTGGERGNASYQMAPYYPDEPPPRFKLRIELDGTQPKFGDISWSQVIHEHFNRNMTCPEAETCPVISPHSHVEWRVLAHDFPGLGCDALPGFYQHEGCGIVAAIPHGSPDNIEVGGEHVVWSASWEATYDPSANTVWSVDNGFSFSDLPGGPASGFKYQSAEWPTGDIVATVEYGPSGDTYQRNWYDALEWTQTANDYTLILASEGPLVVYRGTSEPTITELDAEVDAWKESTEYSLSSIVLHYPGDNPSGDPDFDPGEPFTGFYTNVDGGSLDVSTETGYAVTVTVREAFRNPFLVDGLPPYDPGEPLTDGMYFLVTTGAGKSLLFEYKDSSFSVVHQDHQPELGAVLETSDVDAIAALLSTGSYWYKHGENYYEITSSGQAGPSEESGFTEPVEQAEVSVEYTANYFGGCTGIAAVSQTSECIDVAMNGGTPVESDTEPDGAEGVPGSDDFPDSLEWGVDFTLDRSHQGNKSTRVWTVEVETINNGMDPPYDAGELELTSQTVVGPSNVWVTSMDVGYTKFSFGIPVSNPTPPPATLMEDNYGVASWTEPGSAFDRLWNRNNSTISQTWDVTTTPIEGVVQAFTFTRSVTLKKVVPKWVGTTPPTIAFDGEDDASYDDESDGTFWKLNSILVSDPDEPSESSILANVCATSVELDFRDMSLTIGPEETEEEPEEEP